jgi:hypothetical protein
MTHADLLEKSRAWKDIGFIVEPDEFQESKPALYLFYKLLMVTMQFIIF